VLPPPASNTRVAAVLSDTTPSSSAQHSMDSSVTDEKLWHFQHGPLFAGIGKAEMEELRHITVMFNLGPQERVLTDPGHPGSGV